MIAKSRSDSFYFGAGPALIPDAVMEKAQAEFMSYQGSGVSVLELGHRSDYFAEISYRSQQLLRELMHIPEHYHILFLAGGASSQFAMIPINLLSNSNIASYIHTGHWSGKAIKEAERFCQVHVAASSQHEGFNTIPEVDQWELNKDASYLYYTDNETLKGVEFQTTPNINDVPLISDMTSNFLTRPFDIERYGLVFAGTQKNLGTSGLCIVIIREDLINQESSTTLNLTTPSFWDYSNQVEMKSLMNTPPTYSWYLTGLVLEWIQQQGGVGVFDKKNRCKSEKLYQFIDQSEFYSNQVDKVVRSRLNVSFRLADERLEEKFIQESEEAGLLALKGHRAEGGMRASLYNAMPEQAVDRLIAFMQDFENAYA